MAKKSEPVKSPKGVPGGKRAWKLMDRGATIGAGLLARKVSALTWQTATRRKPPSDTNHPDTDVREVVAWAVIGGAIVELTKALVHRSAATYWLRSTGDLPPGMKSLKPIEPTPEEPAPVKKAHKRKK
ncbi:MAG: DUF4235 domain-containing protein [Aeromicrobium sp.]